MSKLNVAIQDLKTATSQYRIWLHLGWVDIKQRYRRSVIGPWWISLSMLIFIGMMGIVFSRLFHQSLKEYIPFFTAGYLFWTFLSSSITEGAEIFKSHAGFIKQINLPYNLYVFKHIARQVIILLHNFVVYLLVCAFFGLNPGWTSLWVLPGFVLLLINVYWICSLVALFATRFRDIIPIIGSCVQVAFFVTPISWVPKLLDSNSWILKFNPLVYFLDVVRSPLLGITPSNISWSVCIAMAIVGCAMSFYLFASVRSRIAFWVD